MDNDITPPFVRYNLLDDLASHKYFRHVVDVLKNHPYAAELISLHASVLVDGNRILSVGYNRPWRPKFVRQIRNAHANLSTHSEMDCINSCKKRDLAGTKMYVARVLKNRQTIAISRPCAFCQEAMDCVGIKKAIFTTYTGEIKEMKIAPPYIKFPAEMNYE